MTASKPRKRSSRSTLLSRHTRAAHESAQALLSCVKTHPQLVPLKGNHEAQQLMDALEKDAALLADAPKMRIGAARRLQGVSSRRQTTAQALFDACAEVRRRVKVRYRGPRRIELRRSFGEGLPASPAKPETVLAFAQQILAAAPQHLSELREVRVGPPTLQRIESLHHTLKDLRPERTELRVARRQVSDELAETAERVNHKGHTLIALIRRLCPGQDLSFLPSLRPPRSSATRSGDAQ